MDKSEAEIGHNGLIFISLHYFLDMSKKFVFSAVVKSLKRMVFFAANNAINVMFA